MSRYFPHTFTVAYSEFDTLFLLLYTLGIIYSGTHTPDGLGQLANLDTLFWLIAERLSVIEAHNRAYTESLSLTSRFMHACMSVKFYGFEYKFFIQFMYFLARGARRLRSLCDGGLGGLGGQKMTG